MSGDSAVQLALFEARAVGVAYPDGRLKANWRRCRACGRRMARDGPDACLGLIPGVISACCGHGETSRAYVMLGGEHVVTLKGAEAIAFFAFAGRPAPPARECAARQMNDKEKT